MGWKYGAVASLNLCGKSLNSLPIEIMAMERVIEYMLKVQKSPSHRLPRIALEANKKIQETHKSKFLCFGWMQDVEKWFGR